jgi:hypothetical protein
MMSSTDGSQLPDLPTYREFVRIFGDKLEAAQGFVLLPLVGEADALEFLRTVPAGTDLQRFPELAAAWRASHPARE